jgi:Family of unknown function (DUF5681)
MGKKERRPGDPYEVGFAKPPKRTQFKKGRSGNPSGRPPKKPDLYSELTKVLRENVTIITDGQPETVTVQQALLLRLRDQALRGELWAEKLLRRVIGAWPESGSDYEHVSMREVQAVFWRGLDKTAHEKSDAAPGAPEATNAE